MKERIKELSEQADTMADDYLQMPGEFHPDWHDVRDKFFVELIIRECAKAAGGVHGYRDILEHFGVEE